MTVKERFYLLDRGSLHIASVAATASSSLLSVWRSVGEAGVDDLPGVGIVPSEPLDGPFEGSLLREAALGEAVAHPHHIFVMAPTLKHDIGFRQLGRNERVEVGLDALQLLVFLALLGIGGGCRGDFFGSEGHRLRLGAEEHLGVVGKTAQSGEVLALYVGLAAEQPFVVGIAGIEGLLIVCTLFLSHRRVFVFSHRLHRFTRILQLRGNSVICHIFVRNFICAHLCNLWESFILEDDAQSVAAHGGVAHHRVRVGDDLRLHFTESLINICAIRVVCGKYMVEVDERESRQTADVLFSLASLEADGNGEERTLVLETLAAGLAVGLGEGGYLLIAADEVGHSFEKTRQGEFAGHVFENAYVHFGQC